jgi:hypothetical protein
MRAGPIILFLKAQIPGGATRDLFPEMVQVKAYTRRDGVAVQAHPTTVQKRHEESKQKVSKDDLGDQKFVFFHGNNDAGAKSWYEIPQKFPSDELAQTKAVWAVLQSAKVPMGVDEIAARFINSSTVKDHVAAMVAGFLRMGHARAVGQKKNDKGRKHYYVSAIDGAKKHLVAGPYGSHEEAIGHVEHVRAHADARDPRAHFMAWGTAGSDEHHKTPLGPDWKPPADVAPIKPKEKDYGSSPVGDGTFKMVPSGDVVDAAERDRRLPRPKFDNKERIMGMTWEQIQAKQQRR